MSEVKLFDNKSFCGGVWLESYRDIYLGQLLIWNIDVRCFGPDVLSRHAKTSQ